MRGGWMHKLSITKTLIAESNMAMQAGTSTTLPSPVNTMNFGFPAVTTANLTDFECGTFTGGRVRRDKICSISGIFAETSGTITLPITGQTGQFDAIQVGDYIRSVGGGGMIGNIQWGKITAKTTSPQVLTIATGAGAHTPQFDPEFPLPVNFEVYRRMGFEKAGYSLFSASSASTTKLSNYHLLTIGSVPYTTGVVTGTLITLLVPTGIPFKVQLPDSYLEGTDTIYTYMTIYTPSVQGPDVLTRFVLK